MKNKLKCLLIALCGLLGVISSTTQVNAQTYNGRIKPVEYVSGPYRVVHKKGTYKSWHNMQIIARTSDWAFVYCVQPLIIVNEDSTYQVTTEDIEAVLNISQSTWSEISKVAYYGYGYADSTHDHSSDKWYAATQMLIWQKVDPSVESYFSQTVGGERDDSILRNEMNEITSLVNSHLVKPNFGEIPSEMVINESITLTDSNGVLNNFNIANVKGAEITKNGNSITIKATEVGEISFDIQKLGNRYGNAVELYYATDSQNVMHRGNVDPITMNQKIKVYGGTVTTSKTDEDTLSQVPQGEATLEGAVYGVYKEDGTKIGTITTDKNGNATSDYLPSLGRFYLLEEKASTGYELDKNKYYFDITADELNPNIQVFEKVITTKFNFTKVYANSKTGVMQPEKNVQFDIYNNKNELVKSVITDENGMIKFSLPYGTYTLKQVTSTKGYEKAKDIELKVTKTGTESKVIANAEITAKLKVIKVDKDTGEVIKRSGITFKIKNAKTNEYVCQKVTYPKAETLCEFKTDDEGILITPYPLSTGEYLLEEVDQPIDGYTWNKESVKFIIDENTKFTEDEELGVLFETKFENKEVKGNLTIYKTGEIYSIKNNSLEYSTDKLANVTLGLYANEDIYSANGVLKYKKDSLIGTYKTNEKGEVNIDNLYLGKYYIKEIETDNEHILDDSKYELEIGYIDQYTEVVYVGFKIHNQLKTGGLEFTKTDFSTSETLPNTLIEIYNEDDELVFSGRTDENGKIIIEELEYGKYYIIEKEAPEGYYLNDERMYFEILEDGEIVKCTMTDEKIIVEVPDTGMNSYLIPISLLIMIGAAGVIVYEETKNKKK